MVKPIEPWNTNSTRSERRGRLRPDRRPAANRPKTKTSTIGRGALQPTETLPDPERITPGECFGASCGAPGLSSGKRARAECVQR